MGHMEEEEDVGEPESSFMGFWRKSKPDQSGQLKMADCSNFMGLSLLGSL